MIQVRLKDKLLLIGAILATICASAVAAPRDASVVETVLLNALTSSSLVEVHNQTTDTKGTILFNVGKVYPNQTSSSILSGDSAPFTGFPEEAKQALREAADDVVRRAKTGDDLTTPTFSDKRVRVCAEVAPPANQPYFWERPQVFNVVPPGYSANGEYALVRVGTSWSGNMHSMSLVFYLRRTQNGWTVLGRAEIYYV